MDSLTGYIENAKRGGPAGEILIRENLQRALVAMGAKLHVAGSDEEFARLSAEPAAGQYALIFLDPWTFVGPGWIPRPFLTGRESRTFLLSFFGMEEAGHGLALDSAHILTPFPVHAKNALLGYALRPRWRGTVTGDPKRPSRLLSDSEEASAGLTRAVPVKKRQAVVWGKQREYFDGRWEALARLAADLQVELHLTVAQEAMPAAIAALAPGLLIFHGHLDRDGWHMLLGESRFMLGLGDPLSGPSAVDALASGAAFLNPQYTSPKQQYFMSQHPFLQQHVGPPYVCDFTWDKQESLLACARQVLDGPPLPPFIPAELTEAAYAARVEHIFGPVLAAQGIHRV